MGCPPTHQTGLAKRSTTGHHLKEFTTPNRPTARLKSLRGTRRVLFGPVLYRVFKSPLSAVLDLKSVPYKIRHSPHTGLIAGWGDTHLQSLYGQSAVSQRSVGGQSQDLQLRLQPAPKPAHRQPNNTRYYLGYGLIQGITEGLIKYNVLFKLGFNTILAAI